jgi:hypothetical protein
VQEPAEALDRLAFDAETRVPEENDWADAHAAEYTVELSVRPGASLRRRRRWCA